MGDEPETILERIRAQGPLGSVRVLVLDDLQDDSEPLRLPHQPGTLYVSRAWFEALQALLEAQDQQATRRAP